MKNSASYELFREKNDWKKDINQKIGTSAAYRRTLLRDEWLSEQEIVDSDRSCQTQAGISSWLQDNFI
jgi:antibiotic biosynthesis monooxygenase (ABM) superfamily enzyme